jgi:hypothetical protein
MSDINNALRYIRQWLNAKRSSAEKEKGISSAIIRQSCSLGILAIISCCNWILFNLMKIMELLINDSVAKSWTILCA